MNQTTTPPTLSRISMPVDGARRPCRPMARSLVASIAEVASEVHRSQTEVYAREALVWDDDYYWPASSNVDGLMSRQLGSGVLSGILVKVCWI